MAPWKDKLAFLGKARFVTHEVEGDTYNFYRVSAGALFALREAAKVIGGAFAVLMDSTARDSGSTVTSFVAGESVPAGQTTACQAATPEVIKLRLDSKSKAVRDIIDAITDQKNVNVFAQLVIDSLAETFPRDAKDNPTPDQFMKEVDPSALVGMVIGVAKANKGMFGPLGEMLGGLTKTLQDAISVKLAPFAASPAPSPAPTPGETSEIKSSGPSSEPPGLTPTAPSISS